MKFLVLVILVALLGPVIIENVHAQSQENPTPKIFFQIQLRDKDGHVYGYVQPFLQIFDMDRTIQWLAPHSTNSSVTYEGHNYLLMKFEDSFSGSQYQQFGGYFLNVPVDGNDRNVFYAYHDSYITSAGDNGRVLWEALIPSK